MSNAYDDHVQAVGFAGMRVAELQAQLNDVHVMAEEVRGVVAAAVGDSPRNTDAIEAMGMMSELIRLIYENTGMCEGIIARLNSYSGSF